MTDSKITPATAPIQRAAAAKRASAPPATIRTRQQALAAARARWGKTAAIQDSGPRMYDGTAWPTPAERAGLDDELQAHRARKPQPPELASFGDERSVREWRVALAEYETAANAWRAHERLLQGRLLSRRYSVGDAAFSVFHVYGSGDTWAEAFAKADALKHIERHVRARRRGAARAEQGITDARAQTRADRGAP